MITKRDLAIAVVVGGVGFAGGNAFWYLASPLWIDVEVQETVSAAQTTELLSSGTFVDADAIHRGSGNAMIFSGSASERLLRLTEFEVTNGPDLKVWLSAHANPASATDVTENDYVSLGVLKGNIGDQNYSIPADVDLSKYGSVVIWCEQFSVLFSTAALNAN